MAEWRGHAFDLTPFLVNDEEVRFQLGWTSDKFLTVTVYNDQISMHIRKFMFDADKGWIPTKTGIMLSPFEIQEMAHFLPHLGHAYDFVLQRLSQKRLKESDVDSDFVDVDVPKPEAVDTDAVPSLTEEFEELLFSKQCKSIIDEIHRVQEKLCYGCMFNRPGQLDHDICLADWEKKVDRCFDAAFENVSLDLLLEDVKKEIKEKYPYVNDVMLSVLASTIRSNGNSLSGTMNMKKKLLPRILGCMDS